MKRPSSVRTAVSPDQRICFLVALSAAAFTLIVSPITHAGDAEHVQVPSVSDPDPAKLARYLWSGMTENRRKLERGIFVATGRRVIDNWADRSHGAGEVEIFGAFDHEKGFRRFDRTEPLAVPLPGTRADRFTAKLIMTPEQTICWSETGGRPAVTLINGPAKSNALHGIAPFDVRSLGLLFWNQDPTLIDFDRVLKTWTDARLEEVAKESNHIYRITVSSGQNNAVVWSVWVDDSRGFGPIRCEVGSRSGLPIYVSEMVWVQIHGTWIPKLFRNELTMGSRADTYELSFKWDLVNKPVPSSLFTVDGLDLKR